MAQEFLSAFETALEVIVSQLLPYHAALAVEPAADMLELLHYNYYFINDKIVGVVEESGLEVKRNDEQPIQSVHEELGKEFVLQLPHCENDVFHVVGSKAR